MAQVDQVVGLPRLTKDMVDEGDVWWCPGDLRIQAPWTDPSCRELIALPKHGWVCESHRP